MRKLFLLLVMMLISGVMLIQAQNQITGTVQARLNVRQNPNVDAAIITSLAPQTAVIVEGRNAAGDWAFVRTADGNVSGWVAMGFIQFDQPIRIMEDLPLVNLSVANPAGGAGSEPAVIIPLPEETVDFPIVTMHLNNARQIYNRGIARGRNPAVFMKVGESNIAGTVFLCNFQWGNYLLGEYTHFEEIITYFNQTESFCRHNVSAEPGFSAFSLFDPTFSPASVCEANETPIACEIRRSNAMYAFVYSGIGDMMFSEAAEFHTNYTRLVRTLKSNGVIPILATFPMADVFNGNNQPMEFNTVIRDVARIEQVPLIDVRAATFDLENRGTGSDGFHLSVPEGAPTAFNGDQLHFGRVMYEFYALQVLYDLHTALNQ